MHVYPDETGNSELGHSRDIGSHDTLIRCMTNTQIAQERLRAVEQEAALARVQAEYDRLTALRSYEQEAVLAQIEARYNQQLKFLSDMLRTATQALFRTRANMAGIRRLPQEILGEIFIIHVCSNNSSPWVLMHVCRAWRNAALGTRALWGAIQLVPPIKAPVRNVEGREICMKESQVDRALARAGSTPLDLQISFDAKGSGHDLTGRQLTWTNKQRHHIENLLGRVANKMDKSRIRSLNLQVRGSSVLPFTLLDRFIFQDLETLILDGHYPKLIEKAGNQAIRLRHLTLVGSDLEKVANRPWVDRLEGLHILDEKWYGNPVNVTAIYSLLRRLTSLHSLSIEGAILNNPNATPESRIDMPFLKSLNLRYRHICSWPIDCPNLTYLSIEWVYGWYSRIQPGPINLPHLKVFHYRTRNYFGCLNAFIVPALCEFHLDGARCPKTHMRLGMQAIWKDAVTTSNIDPLVFRLHHATVYPKILANAIRNMSRVEEVRIEHTDIVSEFFNELYAIRPPKKNQGVAPNMKELSLDMSGCKSKEDAKAYEKAAKELLTMRRNANMPMKKIEVRLTEKDGWMVFKDE